MHKVKVQKDVIEVKKNGISKMIKIDPTKNLAKESEIQQILQKNECMDIFKDIVLEKTNIAVLHDVLLPLRLELAGRLHRGLGFARPPGLVPVLKLVNVGADETLLKVPVDRPGRLRGRKPFPNRPLAHLVGAAREKTLHVQRLVPQLDDLGQQ